MTDLLKVLGGFTAVSLSLAMLWLAVWSFRRFGIVTFDWVTVVRLSSFVASSLALRGNPEAAENILHRLQGQLHLQPPDTISVLLLTPMTLSLLSTLLLIVLAASEVAHFGRKLSAGYEPPPALRHAYRARVIIGIASAMLAVAPCWVNNYLMRTAS